MQEQVNKDIHLKNSLHTWISFHIKQTASGLLCTCLSSMNLLALSSFLFLSVLTESFHFISCLSNNISHHCSKCDTIMCLPLKSTEEGRNKRTMKMERKRTNSLNVCLRKELLQCDVSQKILHRGSYCLSADGLPLWTCMVPRG